MKTEYNNTTMHERSWIPTYHRQVPSKLNNLTKSVYKYHYHGNTSVSKRKAQLKTYTIIDTIPLLYIYMANILRLR